MKMRVFMSWFAATMVISSQAQAYIDPGVTYAMIQGLFAVAFGVAVGWVLRPWRFIKGLFVRDQDRTTPKSEEESDAPPNPN